MPRSASSPDAKVSLRWHPTDALRAVTAVSVVLAGVGYGSVEASVMFLALGGAMLPRVLAARWWLDAVAVLTMLLAGWFAVVGLYARVGWLPT